MSRMLRQGFEMLFEQFAGPITIIRNKGTAAQTSFQTDAMKNNEERRPEKVMFQFLEHADIQIGDVIQQEGSRDLWQVYELEDSISGGILLSFKAKVRKTEGSSAPRPERIVGHVTVQGSVFGGLQVNSPHSSQNVAVSNVTAITNDVEKLKGLLSDTRINEFDRADAHQALEQVTQLSQREKTGDVLKRVKDKLDVVRGCFSVAKDLGLLAAPYIDSISKMF